MGSTDIVGNFNFQLKGSNELKYLTIKTVLLHIQIKN